MSNKQIKTNWDYSQLAKYYDNRADYSEKLVIKILKLIKCKHNYPVADIGAGTGKLTKLLAKNNLIIHAIEPNLNMMRYGKKNTINQKKLSWNLGTAEKTGLNSNSIFCAFFGSSFNTVNHLQSLNEMKRILIPKGYFCCMWNHRDLNNLHQKEIEKIILKEIPKFNYGTRRIDYSNYLKKQKIFEKVINLKQNFQVNLKKNIFLDGWKSHGTLKRNCKNSKQFKKIIRRIENYIQSVKGQEIKIPYTNVAFLAKLK